jgi:hypothetical protein
MALTRPRFTPEHVTNEIEKKLPPGIAGRRIVLIDQDMKIDRNDIEAIDVRSVSPRSLSGSTIVSALYAVDQDDAGLPFINWLIERGVKFMPILAAEPAHWVHKDIDAKTAIDSEHDFQSAEKFDKFDFGYGDAENICQALSATKRVTGALVEVGCFRGSSGSVALKYMQETGIYRPSYFFDVFDGFTYDAAKASTDAFWTGSHGTEGMDAVAARLKRFDQPKLGRPVNVFKHNIVTDDLPPEIASIAVANLDVDQLEAVYAGLVKLAPRMAVGGILIVEDPGHTPLLIGAEAALAMFMVTPIAQDFTKIYMRSGQFFLIRVSD